MNIDSTRKETGTATVQAFREIERRLGLQEKSLSTAIKNNQFILGFPVFVQSTEPPEPSQFALWYKPGRPGQLYTNMENPSGGWRWGRIR